MKKILCFGALVFLLGCAKEKVPETTFTYAGTVVDIDGNSYNTVTIGTQTWMAENLKVIRYRNGDSIPTVTDGTIWDTLTSGAFCNYDNDNYPASIYGKLYNYYAVTDSRNICPVGWHIPSDSEWVTLITFLGDSAGERLREVGTKHWLAPNDWGKNEFGFTALPGGFRDGNSAFQNVRHLGYFWTSTYDIFSNPNYPMSYNFQITNNPDPNMIPLSVIHGDLSTRSGCSVRCVKD